jgi:hypothetical protein
MNTPRDPLVDLVVNWLRGAHDTSELRHDYFTLRRQRMSDGHQYSGKVAEFMSNIDTAVDSYSPSPDPNFSQIDEAQLRRELQAAIEGLRREDWV